MQTTKIAMFPLQVLMLPGEEMQLHIFEERYQQLLHDCENGAPEFGIPFSQGGKLSQLGTMVRLRKVIQAYSNGSSDIIVEAISNFKTRRFYRHLKDRLYPGGEITALDGLQETPVSAKLYGLMLRYLEKIHSGHPSDLIQFETLNEAARMAPLDSEAKMEFISVPSPVKRDRLLCKLLKFELRLQEQQGSIEKGIYLN